MDDERLKLARAIIGHRVGAAGLSDDQLAILGWDVYAFCHYGRPTVQENVEKAREIIEDNARLRDRESMISGTMRHIRESLREMTPDEFRESLVRAGIIDEDGMLTKPYRKD